MTPNSIQFLCFFTIVFFVYFALNHKYRWIFLLAASYLFYMSWGLEYAFLILFTTVVTYFSGILIGNAGYQRYKKIFIISGISVNIFVLFIFKYFNFLNSILSDLANFIHIDYGIPALNLLLPVGISFYTFQSTGYLIDVYRGTKTPEHNFGILALFISFFPIVLAGPIERSTNLLPQLKKQYIFNYEMAVSGTRLVCWGFFKKLVIADRLSVIVNQIYSTPENYFGVTLLVAALFFVYQVYCDFSGYSDIAIGAARILGFDLVINFKRPFASRSTAEFWRRWHISLFSWFKDYLYIPMGGNRTGLIRWIFNVLFVFAISGLWHGAAWTYVVFGTLQGIFIVASRLTRNIRNHVYGYLKFDRFRSIHTTGQILITFCLFTFSLIVFRAASLEDAIYIYTHLHIGVLDFISHINNPDYFRSVFAVLGVQREDLIIIVCSIIILELVQFIQRDDKPVFTFSSQPFVLRWTEYYILIGSILFFGSFNATQGFIYYKF